MSLFVLVAGLGLLIWFGHLPLPLGQRATGPAADGNALFGALLLTVVLLLSLLINLVYEPEIHPWRVVRRWGWWGLTEVCFWLSLAVAGSLAASQLAVVIFSDSTFSVLWVSAMFLELVLFVGSITMVFGREPLQFWIFGEYPVVSSLFRGVVDFVRIYPWVLGAFLLNQYVMDWMGVAQTQPQSIQILRYVQTPNQITALTFLVVFAAPIGEEWFFRGSLYRLMREWWTPHLAAIVSGGLFASLHFDPAVFLPLLLLGYYLGRTYEQTGSLLAVASMHAAQNALSLAMLLYIL